MGCLVAFLKVWQPAEIWTSPALRTHDDPPRTMPPPAARRKPKRRERSEVIRSLDALAHPVSSFAIWGTGSFKALVNPIFTWNYPIEGLHHMVQKVPPVVAKPTRGGGGLRLHLPVLHGHWHPDRRDYLGLVMGFSPVAAHPGLRRDASGWCAIR